MQFSFLPTEFQKQEGMKSLQNNLQLYDTPYEPEGSGVESDSESVASHRLRENKLPQDDDRPADEYDQPWEWNKVTIPALAGRIPRSEPGNSLSWHMYLPWGEFKYFCSFDVCVGRNLWKANVGSLKSSPAAEMWNVALLVWCFNWPVVNHVSTWFVVVKLLFLLLLSPTPISMVVM